MNTRQHDARPENVVMVAAELFSILMTVTAVVGFSRVFIDSTWVGPLMTAVIVAHLTVIAVRRMGRGLMVAGALSTIVMVLQITWTHYRETLNFGLPTGTTRDAVDTDLTAAWNLFSEVKAPAEPAIGFLVVSTLAIWVVAYLADWAAFRLWSALEAVLPTFAVFVFIAFFGDDSNRLALAGLYLAAVVIFQLFHRLMRQAHEVRWLAGTQVPGTTALMKTGAIVSAVVVLGALVAGPALPGAETDPIFDVDPSSDGPDTRVVVSPIVDIRGRLVQQADVEAFTVRSERPQYWRLASLDNFNGQIWGADNRYARAGGSLDDDFPVDADTQLLTHEVTISNMGAVWVPAAYEPRRVVSSSSDNISYEPVSGTLIVGRSLENSNGLTYTIESEVPTFDPVALEAAPDLYPQEILDRYRQLPDDFSANARALAFEIVADAGATNDYEEAFALQQFFRDNFDYDLNVGAGHSSARVDQFLEARIGYCEQFAGAFAAMARSLGIPARVAVGFTWGDPDPSDPTLYRVRGEHAHAWPEVYIPGSGWVPFEPTPTRGMPGAQTWTEVQPEQAQAGGGTVGQATPTPAPTPTDEFAIPTPDVNFGEDLEFDPAGELTSGSDGPPRWLVLTGLGILIAGAAAGLYAFLVTWLKRNRVRRRFAAAGSNRGRVDAVWRETVESLRPLGLDQQPNETAAEFSDRAGAETSTARAPLQELSSLAAAATYGPSDPSDAAVDAAQGHRDEIAAAVFERTSTSDRIKEQLDPRPLVKR